MSTATATAVTSTPTQPAHGKVTFWDEAQEAAVQASSDVALLTTRLNAQDTTTAGDSGGAVAAAAISAFATTAIAVFAGGNFGLGVAGAVSSSGNLEVTIVNYSSYPVVMYDCRVSYIDIVNMPDPIPSGGTDILSLTGSNAKSVITLLFMVGVGSNAVPCQFAYSYQSSSDSPPGVWELQAAVDGSSEHGYTNQLQMYGLTYTGYTGYPSFSAYTSTTETTSGGLSISFYDMEPEPGPGAG